MGAAGFEPTTRFHATVLQTASVPRQTYTHGSLSLSLSTSLEYKLCGAVLNCSLVLVLRTRTQRWKVRDSNPRARINGLWISSPAQLTSLPTFQGGVWVRVRVRSTPANRTLNSYEPAFLGILLNFGCGTGIEPISPESQSGMLTIYTNHTITMVICSSSPENSLCVVSILLSPLQ